ncbi:zinc-binding dehydrogenase [Agrobacterium sp. 13-626]|uniref:(R,R)-butanediol dehydrogenase / meso-butanediol dehydrogenase / diacetyl reductase n=1 Tax=Agrobacterium fabrum TaxID=1176649 RepID=A0A7Z7BRX7_9HYPH|nr:2,3-butanediol dehydrogenase [Agrobacterium fabrum]OCJ04144.1 zinc-binding dehydrogenase [Agrobacterium sp. 13-626]SDK34641.1 (R,R)-butanediol dehydrogenase / meso-butanediol dehydrogenase / diacetyl reductase [Agrobacterium fabrum]
MRALRFHAAKKLLIEDIEDPTNPAADEVVIENRFTGICGTDLHEYAYGPIFVPTEPHPITGAKSPQVLGHEFGGVVKKIGKDVKHVREGDRVSVQPFITPRGGDYYTDRGNFQLSDGMALAGLSWIGGGMAQATLLKGYNVYKVPEALTDEDAALVEPTAVAVYACDRGGIKPGDAVLVTGAGPIGLLTLLSARAAGAAQLFLSDINQTRLEIAKTILPEVVTINPRNENVGDVLRAATEGNVGCDVALECVGNTHALQTCVDAVRKQGVVVQVGLHQGEAPINWFTVVYKDIDLRGSWAYPGQLWPRVMRLIASGQIPARKVVTKTVSLANAVEDGFDALLDPAGTQLKILIDLHK